MSTIQLDKVERIRRALAGDPVDRPPVSFWAHNFAGETSAEGLAEETVSKFRRYDWDFIKIQNRAGCFSEGWGNRYRFSTEPTKVHELLEWPIHSAADLMAIHPLDPMGGALGVQIDALRMIRQEVGSGIPILPSVFAPAMVLSALVGRSIKKVLELIRDYPKETHVALGMISETYQAYAQACLENGADGIFFAVKAAGADQMTREQYAEFGLPYDRKVLDAAARGWLNMLHLCGSHLYFEVVDDLPSPLINWAQNPGNPGLAAGRERAKRAVIGGVSAKPRIREMAPAEVVAEVRAAIEEAGGIRMMIGPGCSVSPDTPDANLRAAREALER